MRGLGAWRQVGHLEERDGRAVGHAEEDVEVRKIVAGRGHVIVEDGARELHLRRSRALGHAEEDVEVRKIVAGRGHVIVEDGARELHAQDAGIEIRRRGDVVRYVRGVIQHARCQLHTVAPMRLSTFGITSRANNVIERSTSAGSRAPKLCIVATWRMPISCNWHIFFATVSTEPNRQIPLALMSSYTCLFAYRRVSTYRS